MQLGVGADYFVSRHFTAGLSFHYLFEPADLLSDPLNLGTNPFSFTRPRALLTFFDRDRGGAAAPLLLGVRAEHQPHRRAVEAVGLAQLVDQEAAVRVPDVRRVVGADEERRRAHAGLCRE
jgi:hypothetical protein